MLVFIIEICKKYHRLCAQNDDERTIHIVKNVAKKNTVKNYSNVKKQKQRFMLKEIIIGF